MQAMRLKSLEIKGFKSFANETVINFEQDIIGVVGPNGAGKSNVVDAIRWVLGEQKSKELRLEKMSNIIFSGTKKRKAGGLAQVTLNFDNTKNLLPTDYQSVSITRILYRSGESEYRLNGTPCRLKDITSLLMDTGIGSNSYAIIALNMVDDLLTDRNNSRRLMFEQAAGISKYKKRKHETMLKLKNTGEDLDRIEDLLFEIEGQLKALEKQAKRTKKYYELKASYKELSIESAAFKLTSYKSRHEEISSKLQQEEDRYRGLEIESRTLEAALEESKKMNLDKEKSLSDAQRELNELVGNLRTKESDKNILVQKQGFVSQNKTKLSEQIKQGQIRIQQLTEAIDEYRSQIYEEKDLEARLEDELVAVQNGLNDIRENHSSLKTELDEILSEQQAMERLIFELEKGKAINLNQIENLTRDNITSSEEIDKRQKEIKELEQSLNGIHKNQGQKKDQLDNLEREEAQRQTDLSETEVKIEEFRKNISDINRKLDAKRNEYKLTKSMVENLEGFPESIKFLSKNKSWSSAQEVPLLSDLIYCKEDFRVAIENYLDPYLNYYVVQSVDEAYAAILLLNQSQKGKANFFVLDAFKDYDQPMAMLPNNTQRAYDMIETESNYQSLINFLLENVLVTDSDDFKTEVNDKSITLLSKSGRFIKRKYSISGGSVGLFEGKKIGRKKNLEVLEKVIKQLEKEEQKVSTEFFTHKGKLEKLKSQLNNAAISSTREALNQLTQQKVSLMTRLENFETFLKETTARRTQAETQISNLEISNASIEKNLLIHRKIADEAKEKISNTDGSYREVAEKLSTASTAYNEKNIEFIRQQNKVNTIQRELTFKENQLSETKHSLESNQLIVAESEDELIYIVADIKQLEEELLIAYAQKEEKEKNLTNAEQTYFQGRGGINETEDKLRNVHKKSQETQSLINNLKDKFTDLKLEFTSIGERLKIEFGVELNDVMAREPDESLDPVELQEKVGRLKNRLDNYGEINPMAVEAYDEMDERYKNIATQRDDIVEAKKSLLDTIKEIEETATGHFLEAFGKVREYFIDVFRTLFSEDDTCDLLLENPDNPLESPIQIIAKPKGKRPQSINLLSGGEKTLTATALLFSLYLLKPAPFCIFDEVDAPLDDANIEKFNKIIRRFSEKSQFIIVTHNKQTMAAVDVIYGVYMQEQGVSNVSAVDFRELDHASTLQEVVG
ncbi:MAG: chromosome segregation protein [Saprospiraceae bacterium]